MRVMVIDDSQAMRRIISGMLTEAGHMVAEASNGAEALNILKQVPLVDLVLVDWHMPVMNGLDFVQAVRSDHRLNKIRIMMVTTETGSNEIGHALQAGADEYLMKPFTQEIILKKIRLLGL